MGREIRKVPPDWKHPKDENGRFFPMFDEDYQAAVARWKEEGEEIDMESRYYRPFWTPEEATCYQVYENVTEGTPVSPVFEDQDQLFFWLVTTGGYSPNAANKFIETGWAITMTFFDGQTYMNLEMYDIPEKEE